MLLVQRQITFSLRHKRWIVVCDSPIDDAIDRIVLLLLLFNKEISLETSVLSKKQQPTFGPLLVGEAVYAEISVLLLFFGPNTKS
jgi:hypothetical protein